MEHSGAAVRIGPGALSKEVEISIAPLSRAQLPELDSGLINVTGSTPRGYRFGPHRTKFKKPVEITIPYDPAMIPQGIDESEVRGFYFDEVLNRWVPLERTRLDREKHTVTSLSDHFTDIISGTIAVPEHPGTSQFNPSSISGIKAADPGSKIERIASPEIKPTGEAVLQYSLEAPPGRRNMQPRLSVSYSSEAGSSWMGTGWNLSLPSIAVETRWGVPRYNTTNETETYIFNGEMLTPVAHLGETVPREAERRFHPRVEGEFKEIIRHGNTPSAYWWEVKDKSGMRHFYGGDPENGPVAGAALATSGNAGNIHHWALRETRDRFGNSVRYEYELVTDNGTGTKPGYNLYIKTIHYTERKTATGREDGVYSVQFVRDRDLSETRRPDVRVDHRTGGKVVQADLLRRVEMNYTSGGVVNPIRVYEFKYTTHAFGKSVLEKIIQRDGQENEVATHVMEYHDDARDATGNYLGFDAPFTLQGNGKDGVEDTRAQGNGEGSAIGGSYSFTKGGHTYIGFNPTQPQKAGSYGGKVGYSESESHGSSTLMDINGDGLPDKVFRTTDKKVGYRLTQLNDGIPSLSSPQYLESTVVSQELGVVSIKPTEISESSGSTITGNAETFQNPVVMAGFSNGSSETTTYFTDVNGDGLPDLVQGGTVYFNVIHDGKPNFVLDSVVTPVPILRSPPSHLTTVFPAEQLEALEQQQKSTFPPVDVIRVWQAPFNGTVHVTGGIRLLDNASKEECQIGHPDGVKAMVQVNENGLWSATIPWGTVETIDPVLPASLDVAKGDRIYFRLNTIDNGSCDRVSWNPLIEYDGASTYPHPDATGRNPLVFSSSDDFTLVGRRSHNKALFDGTIHMQSVFHKTAVTSDNLTAVLYKNGVAGITKEIASTFVGDVSVEGDIEVVGQDVLELRIHTDSPVDYTKFRWAPDLYYTSAVNPDITVQDGGEYLIHLPLFVNGDLYPDNDRSLPQQSYVAPADGVLSPGIEILMDPDIWGTPPSGDVVFTVKSPGKLLSKRVIHILDGVPDIQSLPGSVGVEVKEGDVIYFDFSVRSPELASAIAEHRVTLFTGATLPSTMHWMRKRTNDNGAETAESAHRPTFFRGWSLFGLNAADGRDAIDFNPVLFEKVINKDYKPEEDFLVSFYPAPDRKSTVASPADRWLGPEEQIFLSKSEQSTSRNGQDEISVASVDEFLATGQETGQYARLISKISKSDNTNAAIGVSLFSGSKTFGDGYNLVDVMDLNGDRYPDILSNGKVIYTLPDGSSGSNSEKETGSLPSSRTTSSDNESRTIGISGTPGKNDVKSGDSTTNGGSTNIQTSQSSQGTSMTPFGLGGEFASGDSHVEYDYMDVNGDGLPDLVKATGDSNGSSTLSVEMNSGYAWGDVANWGTGSVSDTATKNRSLSVSGFNDGLFGWGYGVTLTTGEATTEQNYQDVNGDGLIDQIVPATRQAPDGTTEEGFNIRINTGTSFVGPYFFPGGTGVNGNKFTSETVDFSTGLSVSNDGYITIPIGPLCLAACYIIINPTSGGLTYSAGVSRVESGFRDMNGDGYPDHIYSGNDGELKVSLARVGNSGLLKRVIRPMGSEVTLDYTLTGNTYELPFGKRVLTEVKETDGFAGDGGDLQIRRITYAGPKYDRKEREFYGFKDVTIEEVNGETNALYRKRSRIYQNENYYEKGLLMSEELRDGAGNLYTKNLKSYNLVDVNFPERAPEDSTALPALMLQAASLFPAPASSETFYYEGGSVAHKSTKSTFDAYDSYGNVTQFTDYGDAGEEDDVEARITYATFAEDLYIKGNPDSIKVRRKSVPLPSTGEDTGLLRERNASYYSDTGALQEVSVTTGSTDPAVTTITYDEYGMMHTVTGPRNDTPVEPGSTEKQRYTLTYVYDDVTHGLVKTATDSFGYSSQTTYDYRFGTPEVSTDINGNKNRYVYDSAGRAVEFYGPYQFATYDGPVEERKPTITFEYHPEANVPWAKTDHYDRFQDVPTAPAITTVIFTDGAGKVLQTKKSADIYQGVEATSAPMMTVSGRILFDAFGRIEKEYYPVVEPMGSEGVFNPAFENQSRYTHHVYDVLNREALVTRPGGRTISYQYGFGSDRDGKVQFSQMVIRSSSTVTDPLEIKKELFKDVKGAIVGLKEYHTPTGTSTTQELWTSYVYSPMGEILEVKDAANQITSVTYDLAGRRISITNPDTGAVATTYDPAGNVVAKSSQNLQDQQKEIAYVYNYNRLEKILYPLYPDNNVTYGFGAPGAANNGAGRVIAITDRSGSLLRSYGMLGEVVEETKTVNTLPTPSTYTTRYEWDSFGRMHSLLYPDGEKLTYMYDRGGLLKRIYGEVEGQLVADYVARLEYDRFGRRKYLDRNNTSETEYFYDEVTRRLSALKSDSMSDAEIIQDIVYEYDHLDNITRIANNQPISKWTKYGGPMVQIYTYDDLNRLETADGTWRDINRYTLSMEYDGVHNTTRKNQKHWLIKNNGGEDIQAPTTYDWSYGYASSHPHAPTSIGEVSYSYDSNGNQTGFVSPNLTRTMEWDEENRVRSLSDGGSTSEYLYDDAGQRVLKRTSQGETVYVNQFFTVRNGTIITKHIFAGSDRIATKVHTDRSQDLYYYHTDHLGSTNYVLDGNGEIYEHMEYFPFGELWVAERASTERTPYLFTSKELDEETGLYYFGARYYDARTSVWQSTDPILGDYLPTGEKEKDSNLPGMGGVFQTSNLSLFAYGFNNPIRIVDPDGNAGENVGYKESWELWGGKLTAEFSADTGYSLDTSGLHETGSDDWNAKLSYSLLGGEFYEQQLELAPGPIFSELNKKYDEDTPMQLMQEHWDDESKIFTPAVKDYLYAKANNEARKKILEGVTDFVKDNGGGGYSQDFLRTSGLPVRRKMVKRNVFSLDATAKVDSSGESSFMLNFHMYFRNP